MNIKEQKDELTKLVLFSYTSNVCLKIYLSVSPQKVIQILQDSLSVNTEVEELENSTLEIVKEHVLIRRNNGYSVRYALSDIMYIRAQRDYCDLFLSDNTCVTVSTPLVEACKDLQVSQFMRVHRSYVLNIAYIKKQCGNQFIMSNGEVIPIGRKYRDEVDERFIIIGPRTKRK